MTPSAGTIRVETAQPYDVVIGRGLREKVLDLVGPEAARVAIIHGPNVADRATALRMPLADAGLAVRIIEVPDAEQAKTASVLAECWRVLGEAGFTRSDVVVGLGGGATTDLAGFVAATWLRGVRFVNVPTTVLGMVDAAVGGKTGINTAQGKNLVGAFHEPVGVLCDLDALQTLTPREVRSGLAEIVKCGFIADPSILDLVEADPRSASDTRSDVLAQLIAKGIAVKAVTVKGDLRESGGARGAIGREALNYGHTLGHAIERHEAYEIRHGEAISIGMVFVAELARAEGLIDDALVERHRAALGTVGLPTAYRGDAWPHLLEAMRLDKKTRGSTLRFVVLDGLASPQILPVTDELLLRDAYRAVSG
ncbi:3-dehydroquinate synthase [Aeromicrobium sp. Leaf350]|uniref:3-dehydroquinate synthase n=1 Tax=Aeromicrobium sp. Leaf350 TaxID=2876565 RepID=UPI001E3F0652|nr:3-dehydroquinate synthase [Aeromicrobium sp. Leaf350]